MVPLAATFLESSGFFFSIILALGGLAFALHLIKSVVALPAGDEKMKQIAGAIEEGAKAYLNRQVASISKIAVVITILLFIFKDQRPPSALCSARAALCSPVSSECASRCWPMCAPHRVP
jgi:K(+)-stimulated pyrophosphate-energized sodium pump